MNLVTTTISRSMILESECCRNRWEISRKTIIFCRKRKKTLGNYWKMEAVSRDPEISGFFLMTSGFFFVLSVRKWLEVIRKNLKIAELKYCCLEILVTDSCLLVEFSDLGIQLYLSTLSYSFVSNSNIDDSSNYWSELF